MNCREAERLLDTFFDGELDGRLMRDAALHITRCQSCERELQEKEAVKSLLTDTIEADVGASDLSSIWAGVEAGLSQSDTTPAPADAPLEAEAQPRRAFGRRAGGRHADTARRGGRRGVGRISAAGMGAVAMGLAAFLVFNVGPEQENEPLLADSAADPIAGADRMAESASGAVEKTTVAGKSGPTMRDGAVEATTAVASASTKPKTETVASLGPVLPSEPLSSEWTQQVQVGPLDYSDHAMSLWRPAAAR